MAVFSVRTFFAIDQEAVPAEMCRYAEGAVELLDKHAAGFRWHVGEGMRMPVGEGRGDKASNGVGAEGTSAKVPATGAIIWPYSLGFS
jgi:hypothetical protein